jgi:ABC-type branched-subunit amino acid transport system ATPase component
LTNSLGLQLRGLSKRFGGTIALDAVSAHFSPGQVASIVGANGAGKTTVFNLIGGFVKPDAGEVVYRGAVLNGKRIHAIARRGVERTFQQPRVFGGMSVLDNVATAGAHVSGESAMWALLWPLVGSGRESANLAKSRRWLEFVQLESEAERPAATLSFGQQKRLDLARLLNSDADCLLLDEPTAGLKHEAAKAILGMIRRMADEGKTVVMIEHNLDAVQSVSDVVHLMDRGRILDSGPPARVLRECRSRLMPVSHFANT